MPCVPQAAMAGISTTSNQKQSSSHMPWSINSMDAIFQVNGQEHSLCQCVLQVHSLHGHPLCSRCTHCVDRWCTHCAIGALIVLIGAQIVLPGALIALTGAHYATRCPHVLSGASCTHILQGYIPIRHGCSAGQQFSEGLSCEG